MTLDSPERKEWRGKYGMVVHIFDAFKITRCKRRVVQRMLEGIEWCETQKLELNGKDKRQYNKGRTVVIVSGSDDESNITDWTQINLGFRNTLIMVNTHCVEKGR